MVRTALASTSVALPGALRSLFEHRLGGCLERIRLHVGPHAVAATTLLGARAFTLGPHIVFNAGEYDPRSTRGLRLLAHELAHALQQRDVPGAAAAIKLGAAADPAEDEAELAALRFMAGEPPPRITRDAGPSLRRVIIIKAPATTRVEVVTAGVLPEPNTRSGARGDSVAFNLGNGFNAADPRASGLAFRFRGRVGVTFEPGDPTSDFTFGWIQFMKQVSLTMIYAGREDTEGQIEVNPLPLIGTRFLIDRDPLRGAGFSPFAQNPGPNTRFDSVAKEVVASFGDHPMSIVPQIRFNTRTRFDNFLFSLVDSRKIVSIFAVRDKFGRFTSLAHLNTDLLYSGTFKWRERTILPVSNLSSFTPGSVAKGAPRDPEIASLLGGISPSISPAYNATAQSAFATAFAPGSGQRRDLDRYEARIPALFFLDGPGSLDIP